jgi:hypothetical protein
MSVMVDKLIVLKEDLQLFRQQDSNAVAKKFLYSLISK